MTLNPNDLLIPSKEKIPLQCKSRQYGFYSGLFQQRIVPAVLISNKKAGEHVMKTNFERHHR